MKKKVKDLEYKQLSVKIPNDLYESLKKKSNSFISLSLIIREALEYYVKTFGTVQVISEVKPLRRLVNPGDKLDLNLNPPGNTSGVEGLSLTGRALTREARRLQVASEETDIQGE